MNREFMNNHASVCSGMALIRSNMVQDEIIKIAFAAYEVFASVCSQLITQVYYLWHRKWEMRDIYAPIKDKIYADAKQKAF